jgi:hypothetical protein
MEAPEVPTEHLQEHLQEHAEHASGHERWISWVALSSAIIAALAAVASLLAGAHANEAMIHQMQASDQWNYYQAKGVKANVLASKIELLTALGKTPDPKDQGKVAEYKKEQESIKEEAEEKTRGSEEHLEDHETLARAVTLFQVAIALGAVSALTKRRRYWIVSVIAAVIGAIFLAGGLKMHYQLAAVDQKAKEAEAAREKAEHEKAGHEKAGHGAPAAAHGGEKAEHPAAAPAAEHAAEPAK